MSRLKIGKCIVWYLALHKQMNDCMLWIGKNGKDNTEGRFEVMKMHWFIKCCSKMVYEKDWLVLKIFKPSDSKTTTLTQGSHTVTALFFQLHNEFPVWFTFYAIFYVPLIVAVFYSGYVRLLLVFLASLVLFTYVPLFYCGWYVIWTKVMMMITTTPTMIMVSVSNWSICSCCWLLISADNFELLFVSYPAYRTRRTV